jgi:hypothetical protein
MGRKIGWYVSIAVLLLTSALSLLNEPGEFKTATTALQMSVTVGGLAHAIVGLAAAAALIRKAPAARWLTLLWTLIVAYVSSTASIAYGGDDATIAGAIAGGLGAALIGLAINWCARVITREPNAAVGQPSAAVR